MLYLGNSGDDSIKLKKVPKSVVLEGPAYDQDQITKCVSKYISTVRSNAINRTFLLTNLYVLCFLLRNSAFYLCFRTQLGQMRKY